jgi:predicted nucleotidyltransferase
MNRDDVITILRPMERMLRSQGLSHLYLFGSVARQEARRGSDVDLAYEVTPEAAERFSLLDRARIGRQLSEALDVKVDLLRRDALRPRVAEDAAADMIQIF